MGWTCATNEERTSLYKALNAKSQVKYPGLISIHTLKEPISCLWLSDLPLHQTFIFVKNIYYNDKYPFYNNLYILPIISIFCQQRTPRVAERIALLITLLFKNNIYLCLRIYTIRCRHIMYALMCSIFIVLFWQ